MAGNRVRHASHCAATPMAPTVAKNMIGLCRERSEDLNADAKSSFCSMHACARKW